MLPALPVGSGDAFLLQRHDGTTILVDGGGSRSTLTSQVQSVLANGAIDVVVSTHADADHANGLIGLLRESAIPVREVWLPGRWAARLTDLLGHDDAWIIELIGDIELADTASLEEFADRSCTEIAVSETECQAMDINEVVTGSVHFAIDHWPLAAFWRFPLMLHVEASLRTASARMLFSDALATAERIRSLTLAAHHHGARIRWVDFRSCVTGNAPAGGNQHLQPLNSVEICPGEPIKKPGMLRYLALSVANRESLVFVAPETATDSGVVFTADSDMACHTSIPAFTRHAAVTTPHHGSEANAVAYQRVSAKLEPALGAWIRSDGNYAKRPGRTFLQQPCPRICTICRGSGSPKRQVQLMNGTGGWIQPLAMLCQCN